MENNEENLFVYGTLMDSKVQKSVFGRITKGIPDILERYRKSEIEIGKKKYPAIVLDKDNFVEGLVISIIPIELKLIDKYETDAYKREQVVLKSGKTAWVYVKT